jgi:hypothetical protein
MKTFLRTTLFRIVAAIAFLIVSGFGYNDRRLTPVFNQSYLIQWIPTSVTTQIADKAVSDYQHAETQTQDPTETTPLDPAKIIETDGITDATTLPAVRPQREETTTTQPVNLPAARPQEFSQADNNELLIGQANLSQQINEQFAKLSQQLSSITSFCQGNGETQAPIIDESAQKKAELQAQIEQLQSEMSSL